MDTNEFVVDALELFDSVFDATNVSIEVQLAGKVIMFYTATIKDIEATNVGFITVDTEVITGDIRGLLPFLSVSNVLDLSKLIGMLAETTLGLPDRFLRGMSLRTDKARFVITTKIIAGRLSVISLGQELWHENSKEHFIPYHNATVQLEVVTSGEFFSSLGGTLRTYRAGAASQDIDGYMEVSREQGKEAAAAQWKVKTLAHFEAWWAGQVAVLTTPEGQCVIS